MFPINSLFVLVCWLLVVRDTLQQQADKSICAQRVETSKKNQLVCEEACASRPEEDVYYDLLIVNDDVGCYRKCNITKAVDAANNGQSATEENQTEDKTESSTETVTGAGRSMVGTKTHPPTAMTEIASLEDTKLPVTLVTESTPTVFPITLSKLVTTELSIESFASFDNNSMEQFPTELEGQPRPSQTGASTATSFEDVSSSVSIVTESIHDSEPVTSKASAPTAVDSNAETQSTGEALTAQTLNSLRTPQYSVKPATIATEASTLSSDESQTALTSSSDLVSVVPRQQTVTKTITSMAPSTTAEDETVSVVSVPVTTLLIPSDSNTASDDDATVNETSMTTEKTAVQSTLPLSVTTQPGVSATEQATTAPSSGLKAETLPTAGMSYSVTTMSEPNQLSGAPTGELSTDVIQSTEQSTNSSASPSSTLKSVHTSDAVFTATEAETLSQGADTESKLRVTSPAATDVTTSKDTTSSGSETSLEAVQTITSTDSVASETTYHVTLSTPEEMESQTSSSYKLLETLNAGDETLTTKSYIRGTKGPANTLSTLQRTSALFTDNVMSLKPVATDITTAPEETKSTESELSLEALEKKTSSEIARSETSASTSPVTSPVTEEIQPNETQSVSSHTLVQMAYTGDKTLGTETDAHTTQESANTAFNLYTTPVSFTDTATTLKIEEREGITHKETKSTESQTSLEAVEKKTSSETARSETSPYTRPVTSPVTEEMQSEETLTASSHKSVQMAHTGEKTLGTETDAHTTQESTNTAFNLYTTPASFTDTTTLKIEEREGVTHKETKSTESQTSLEAVEEKTSSETARSETSPYTPPVTSSPVTEEMQSKETQTASSHKSVQMAHTGDKTLGTETDAHTTQESTNTAFNLYTTPASFTDTVTTLKVEEKEGITHKETKSTESQTSLEAVEEKTSSETARSETSPYTPPVTSSPVTEEMQSKETQTASSHKSVQMAHTGDKTLGTETDAHTTQESTNTAFNLYTTPASFTDTVTTLKVEEKEGITHKETKSTESQTSLEAVEEKTSSETARSETSPYTPPVTSSPVTEEMQSKETQTASSHKSVQKAHTGDNTLGTETDAHTTQESANTAFNLYTTPMSFTDSVTTLKIEEREGITHKETKSTESQTSLEAVEKKTSSETARSETSPYTPPVTSSPVTEEMQSKETQTASSHKSVQKAHTGDNTLGTETDAHTTQESTNTAFNLYTTPVSFTDTVTRLKTGEPEGTTHEGTKSTESETVLETTEPAEVTSSSVILSVSQEMRFKETQTASSHGITHEGTKFSESETIVETIKPAEITPSPVISPVSQGMRSKGTSSHELAETVYTEGQTVTTVTDTQSITQGPAATFVSERRQETVSKTTQPTTEPVLKTTDTGEPHVRPSEATTTTVHSKLPASSMPTEGFKAEPIISTVESTAEPVLPTIVLIATAESKRPDVTTNSVNSSKDISTEGFKAESPISTAEPILPTIVLIATAKSEIPSTERPDTATSSVNSSKDISSTTAESASEQSATSVRTYLTSPVPREEPNATFKTDSTKLTFESTTETMLLIESRAITEQYRGNRTLTDTTENTVSSSPVSALGQPQQEPSTFSSIKSTKMGHESLVESTLPTTSPTATLESEKPPQQNEVTIPLAYITENLTESSPAPNVTEQSREEPNTTSSIISTEMGHESLTESILPATSRTAKLESKEPTQQNEVTIPLTDITENLRESSPAPNVTEQSREEPNTTFRTESTTSEHGSTTVNRFPLTSMIAKDESEAATELYSGKTTLKDATGNFLPTTSLSVSEQSITSIQTLLQTKLSSSMSRQETDATSRTEPTKLAFELTMDTMLPTVAKVESEEQYSGKTLLRDATGNFLSATTPLSVSEQSIATVETLLQSNLPSPMSRHETDSRTESPKLAFGTTMQTMLPTITNVESDATTQKYRRKTSLPDTTENSPSVTSESPATKYVTQSKISVKYTDETEIPELTTLKESSPQAVTEKPVIEAFVTTSPERTSETFSQISNDTTINLDSYGTTLSKIQTDTVSLWTMVDNESTGSVTGSKEHQSTLSSVMSDVTVPTVEATVTTLPSVRELLVTKPTHKDDTRIYLLTTEPTVQSSPSSAAVTQHEITVTGTAKLMEYSKIPSAASDMFTTEPASDFPTILFTKSSVVSELSRATSVTRRTSTIGKPVVTMKPLGILSILNKLHGCTEYPCVRPQKPRPEIADHSQFPRPHEDDSEVAPIFSTTESKHIDHHQKVNACQPHGRLSRIHNLQHCDSQSLESQTPRVNSHQRNMGSSHHRIMLDLLHKQSVGQNISDGLQKHYPQLNHSDRVDYSTQNRKSNVLNKLHPQQTAGYHKQSRVQQQPAERHRQKYVNESKNRPVRPKLSGLHRGDRGSDNTRDGTTGDRRLENLRQKPKSFLTVSEARREMNRHNHYQRQQLQHLRNLYLYSHRPV